MGLNLFPQFQTYNADDKKSPSFNNSDIMKMLVSQKVDKILIWIKLLYAREMILYWIQEKSEFRKILLQDTFLLGLAHLVKAQVSQCSC